MNAAISACEVCGQRKRAVFLLHTSELLPACHKNCCFLFLIGARNNYRIPIVPNGHMLKIVLRNLHVRSQVRKSKLGKCNSKKAHERPSSFETVRD